METPFDWSGPLISVERDQRRVVDAMNEENYIEAAKINTDLIQNAVKVQAFIVSKLQAP
jgi:hypothetical protein